MNVHARSCTHHYHDYLRPTTMNLAPSDDYLQSNRTTRSTQVDATMTKVLETHIMMPSFFFFRSLFLLNDYLQLNYYKCRECRTATVAHNQKRGFETDRRVLSPGMFFFRSFSYYTKFYLLTIKQDLDYSRTTTTVARNAKRLEPLVSFFPLSFNYY
jgi:hypothetical protein